MKEFLTKELDGIKAAGLYKNERIITTPQRAGIKLATDRKCSTFAPTTILDFLTTHALPRLRRKP